MTAIHMSNDHSELEALLGDLPLGDQEVKYEGAEEDETLQSLQDLIEPAPTEDDGADTGLGDLALEAELVAAAEGTVEPEAEPVAEVDEEAGLAALEFELDKAELYGSAKSIAADPEATPPEPKKRTRAASSGVARVPRDISSVADEFFVLEGDPASISDLSANRAATEALRPTQKKVAEKFDNLFTAISVGKEPSRYVTIAFALLREKTTFTSAELVAAYRAPGARTATEGYDVGTASSQAGQIMNLFSAVKLASRTGQTLTQNPDSLLFKRLDAIIPA